MHREGVFMPRMRLRQSLRPNPVGGASSAPPEPVAGGPRTPPPLSAPNVGPMYLSQPLPTPISGRESNRRPRDHYRSYTLTAVDCHALATVSEVYNNLQIGYYTLHQRFAFSTASLQEKLQQTVQFTTVYW